MKYLLVLLVVVIAISVWRNNRRAEREAEAEAAPRPQPPRPLAGPDRMLACAHCGLHLPAAEAVTGRQGAYCSAEHRRLAEG